jgi:hypothetical protein
MRGNLEQAMWYINIVAAAILLARLYAHELVRVYPFLCAYLFADTLEQIVASVFVQLQRRHIYAEIYFAGETVKVALAIFVILELYQHALAQQPVLARFGRRMLGYLFAIDVAFGLINLLLELEGANRRQGALLGSFLKLERSVDLFALMVLISIAGFLLWFPVRVRRNVAIGLGGILLYWSSRWMGLLLLIFFPRLTHELGVAMLAASLAYLIGWSVMLKPAGEVF